jgi:hypothetical protein
VETKNELIRLSRLPLATEDDVREEFVTPLLRLLGYDHARGDIRRGQALSTPYKSGTKRKEYIVPDYLAQLNGLVGIALDAKSPASTEERARQIVLDPEYVGQVHSYAAHREVQAPLFVVTNGQCTAVFETARTTFDPVIVVPQHELTDRFAELAALLSRQSISQQLAVRLPPAWTVALRQRNVGFQPINLDVGDVNQDGFLEVAIALSENHIPIINSRGDQVASIETDGWVWWVKCTGATGPGEATLIALQHNRGPRDTTGKLLGINGSRIIWEHLLPRAGSGFEELDRIVIDSTRQAVVFGVACDTIVSCVSLTGDQRWTTRVADEGQWGSLMHVLRPSTDTVLATVGGRSAGVLGEVDAGSGTLRGLIALPFRGAQIAPLDAHSSRLAVGNADGAEIAIVDRSSRKVIAVVATPTSMRNPRLAVSTRLGLLVIAGASRLTCYPLAQVEGDLPEPLWTSDDIRGYINRLSWIETSRGLRLLASTCGTMAAPHPNGIYMVTPSGAVEHRHYLASDAIQHFGLTGVRDVKASTFSRGDAVDIVAIADDSRLYVWHPA